MQWQSCITGSNSAANATATAMLGRPQSEVKLRTNHLTFVPQVELSDGTFLWLSAPKQITGGIPFPPGSTDLQTWIRNSDLDPNWLRVGTDITGQGPFNAS